MAAIAAPVPATPAPKSTYAITGVPVKDEPQVGPYKKAGVRQNIDDWSSDEDNEMQVKLFVLALHRFQQIDPAERDSYFQIAGIHGQPNVPWDEDIPESEAADKGYCTHNNILFPVWHRPYLALYEQRIYEIMINEIIPNFPSESRTEWREAADQWRLPFWDWGRTNKVPKLAKYPTTVVPNDNGEGERRIDNPLFQFKMPTGLPMRSNKVADFKDPWVAAEDAHMLYYGDAIGTSRWPDDEDIVHGSEAWKHGVVNNYKVEDALKGGLGSEAGGSYGSAGEMMYRILTIPMDYPTFASTAQLNKDASVQNDLNLEFIHNNIHGYVGGDYNGHMSQIPVATFDPLFWLHHCNIDRIFALWQALNPDEWFKTGTVNEFFQHTIGLTDPNTVITPETPLRPFHTDAKGTCWTPNGVRWTYNLGYTYPELQTWKESYNPGGTFNSEAFLKDLRKYINDTYGVSRKLLSEADPSLKGTSQLDDATKVMDYAFSIRYKKFAFGGDPFWIRLYISQDQGKQNPTLDLVASVYNFSQSPETNGKVTCTNCKKGQKENVKCTAYVSITGVLLGLIKAGKNLASLAKEDVLAYLQKRAYWRVFKNGKEQPSYEVEKVELEIIGSSNDNTQFNDPTKLPKLDNFKEEPTLKGGSDGALDNSLKQPTSTPPPPVDTTPKGNLPISKNLPFPAPLAPDSVVLIQSSKLDLTPSNADGIDNSQIWFTTEPNGGDIPFLLSVRRKEGQIVLNTKTGGTWGRETRFSLADRFKKPKPAIMIHDQGDGYEISIDWRHAAYFPKPDPSKAASGIHYSTNKGHTPVWSKALDIKVFPSMAKLFGAVF